MPCPGLQSKFKTDQDSFQVSFHQNLGCPPIGSLSHGHAVSSYANAQIFPGLMVAARVLGLPSRICSAEGERPKTLLPGFVCSECKHCTSVGRPQGRDETQSFLEPKGDEPSSTVACRVKDMFPRRLP